WLATSTAIEQLKVASASPVSRHISQENRLSAFRMANGTAAMPSALSVRAMVMPISEPFAAPSVHMCVSRGHTLAAALGAAQAAKTAAQQIHLIAARMRYPLSAFASPNPDATPLVGMRGGALAPSFG